MVGFLTGTLQGVMAIRQRLGLLACVLGAAGTLSGVLAPVAGASPEQDFYSQVYLYAHPSVTGPRLLELGNLTCSVRRNGQSTNDAKVAVYKSLIAQGVVSASAEYGSLVHAAIDTLCPEVGYP